MNNGKIRTLIEQFNTSDSLFEPELAQYMNESQRLMFQRKMDQARKRKKVGALLCIFWGWLGAHRHYIGEYKIGAAYTIVGLIAGLIHPLYIILFIVSMVDFLSIMDKIDKYNRRKALQFASQVEGVENPLIVDALEKAAAQAYSNNFELAIKELRAALAMPGCAEDEDIKYKLIEYQNNFDRQQVWKASELAAKSNFDAAVAVLDKIQIDSDHYEESQVKRSQYRKSLHSQLLHEASAKIQSGQLNEALNALKKIPEDAELYPQAEEKMVECQEKIKQRETERELAMQKAEQEKQELVASNLVKSAFVKADGGNFSEAIQLLKNVPQSTAAYHEAATKMAEYEEVVRQIILKKEKLDQEKLELIAKHKNLVPINYKGKIVAAARVDDTIHLVDSIKRISRIEKGFGNAVADGEFLIVHLFVRNDSKKTRTISASAMTILDAQEREFRTSSHGSSALLMSGEKTSEVLVTEIHPGLEKAISIVFDIPPGDGELKLKVPSGGFGSPAILPLALAL